MLSELISAESRGALTSLGQAPRGQCAAVPWRDGRARRFGEIESLILRRERALRLETWAVPECDRTRRELAVTSAARRREQLARSAQLAERRRAVSSR